MEVSGADTRTGFLQLVPTKKQVVECLDAVGSDGDPQESPSGRKIVDERIARKIQLVNRPLVALRAIRNDDLVLTVGALLDDVAHDVGDPAVRKLQFVACTAFLLIGEPVVVDSIVPRPGLHEVAKGAAMDITAAKGEAANASDVNLVARILPRVGLRHSVVAKLRALDQELGRWTVPGQQSHLVPLEKTYTGG